MIFKKSAWHEQTNQSSDDHATQAGVSLELMRERMIAAPGGFKNDTSGRTIIFTPKLLHTTQRSG